jgi:tRNA pseudouridine38-40 synthase
MELQRYRLDIQFRGTAYQGWQKQTDKPTVQGVLESKLQILLRQPIQVTGCGRTDSGVHARHFPMHFDSPVPLPDAFMHRLNGLLPADIAALHLEPVTTDFHARFKASSREYRYYIHFGKQVFLEDFSWRLSVRPDSGLMNAAASLLPAHQDFRCFTKGEMPQHHGYGCLLEHAAWETTGNGLVFTVRANRFLRNMVRAMVGTLLEVGYRHMSLDEFENMLRGGTRSDAGPSVPAHGLFLEQVFY